MKRAIVTGATGFVGANLARRLLRDGHEVHLLVRPHTNRWRLEEIREDVHLHELTLEDAESVEHAVSNIAADWIFHLAASGAYSWQKDLQQMVQVNIQGTINLVQACLRQGFESLVNTGSSSEYGFKDHAPSEADYLEPNSHYSFTKASATLFCQCISRTQQVRIPTLRLYSVFGPYEEPNRLMPTLIVSGLKGKLPPLVDPNIARDYVYVEDVNDAYLLAAQFTAQEFGAIYNVGSGIQTSIKDLVDLARDELRVLLEPQWGSMPNRTWDTSIWVSDNRKLRAIGWQPRHSLQAGFREMADWLRRTPFRPGIYDRQCAAMSTLGL